jgi:hypothetical protein
MGTTGRARPRGRRRLRAVAVAIVTLLLSGPVLLATAATTDVAFTIRDSRVTESSGLVRDKRAKVYWTVNDSSAEGTVYGVRKDGNVQGIIGFRAQPEDVEAVAMSGRRLYVADIGDNKANRDHVTVYFFNGAQPDNKTVPYRSYDFTYPDGAHDAETLLVNPDGRLYLVTKGLKGGVYAAPESPSRQKLNKLERVGDAPAFVTDGVFLPGGKQIALRTYVSVEVVDAGSYRTVARVATSYQKQSESIAVSLDGKSLLVGSEGKRSSVLQVAVPTKLTTAPSAGATPPPSSTPTPSASSTSDSGDGQDDTGEEDQSPPVSRAGTILALSLAGLVALVAGVVVAARKR